MSAQQEHPNHENPKPSVAVAGGRAAPSPRRLFVVASLVSIIGLVIALSFGYADHSPTPHGVRIAVNAPAAVSTQLATGLDRAEPGGFTVITVRTPALALRAVRDQSAAGGVVLPAAGPATIVTAGATGVSQQQVITAALSGAATMMKRQVRTVDVAPLPATDRAGLSSFVFTLALLIPSVLGSVALFLVGARLRLWWRVAASALFALLVAAAVTLVMDTIFGALTGAGPTLIAIGFLGALSFVLFVAAIQALVGLPGTGLAAVTLIFVGNAISGGSVPIGFLPDGFRQIAPWLPNGAIVSSVRDAVHFSGHNLGHPLLVLCLWPAVSVAVLVAVDLLHLAERRRTPHLAGEIYATPGVVHARRRLALMRAADAVPVR